MFALKQDSWENSPKRKGNSKETESKSPVITPWNAVEQRTFTPTSGIKQSFKRTPITNETLSWINFSKIHQIGKSAKSKRGNSKKKASEMGNFCYPRFPNNMKMAQAIIEA